MVCACEGDLSAAMKYFEFGKENMKYFAEAEKEIIDLVKA